MKLKGLLCIILLISQSVAFGTEHCEANKVLSVTASKPEGLKNFTSFPFENDFYFVGEREREGAINFKVSLSVQSSDFTLKAPETNPVTKSTNGGVITEYEVVKTAGGEKKISGKVYLVVLSAEICETFKVDDDVVIGVSKGKSENPKTKLMAEAVGADDWTATIKLMPDDKSVEILEPTELSKSSNLTNIRITKGYEFEKKEPKKLELSFKIKGKEVKVVKNLDLLPVEIKVNDTIKEEDDLVPVSKGTDEDLATDFSVKVSGMGGLTADLKVKGADGGIKFKDQTLTLTDGVEAKTKLWGTSPSSDKDKTIIEITLKKDGKELGKIEEEVTVFKGAKLEFEGNYYINVDTREFARRPWDGRVDPKPNSKGSLTGNTAFMSADIGASPTAGELTSFKKAVDQSFSFGYQSAISFKQGDNSEIPKYKPWKDKLEVKITKVMSKQPSFEIKDDEIVDALLELKKGVLDGLPDGNEQLIDPEVKIGDYLIFDKTSITTRILAKADGAPTVTAAQVTAQINAQRGSGYDELLDYYMRAVGTPPAPWRPTAFAGFSHRRFEWKNDSFEVQKGTKFKDSFAAKAIRGEKENGGKLEVKWIFTGWNEFKFQGDLDDAVIETK